MTSFTGGPGFAAFVVTFVLVAAAIVLFLSLSKHLRKVRTRPPEDDEAATGTTLSVEDDQGDGDEVAEEPRDR